MDTEHGKLFFQFICFYFYSREIVAFTSRHILLSVFWTLAMIMSLMLFLFLLYKKGKMFQDTRFSGVRYSFWFV